SKHPDITVENAAVAGGAGTNAKAVLAARMQGNDPPSTFQVHGGAELNESWVEAEMMEPLNDFYEEYDLMDKFPEELIELVSKDGNIYSRSEEHTSELQSRENLVCRLLLEKKKK